jgi:hypothetical protein
MDAILSEREAQLQVESSHTGLVAQEGIVVLEFQRN